MDAVKGFLADCPWLQKVIGGVIAAGSLVFLVKYLKNRKRVTYPRDTVIIHHVGRGPNVPSLTPFGIKLETFCRMANVKYQTVHSYQKSTKGKVPWIEYNDTAVPDSEFSVQFLNKELGINLNSHLTPEQDGAGLAFQRMLEENTYWTFILDWVFDDTSRETKTIMPWIMTGYYKRLLRKVTWAHGIGRHNEQEVFHIMRTDLEAFSNFLGKKDFLLGDQPCQYDCAVFGILTEIRWSSFGRKGREIIQEFPNVCGYCERMKNKFWPDWDQCTTSGETREATR